jgi:hypothetical protein
VQLRLPEPTGSRDPTGTHISIRGPLLKEWQFEAFGELLWGYGCPDDALERVLSSLAACGRYDCVVVTRAFPSLRAGLSDFGYELITQATCEYRKAA